MHLFYRQVYEHPIISVHLADLLFISVDFHSQNISCRILDEQQIIAANGSEHGADFAPLHHEALLDQPIVEYDFYVIVLLWIHIILRDCQASLYRNRCLAVSS